MHFRPEINWCVVFIQIRQHHEFLRGEKNPRKCLLRLTARGEDESSSRVRLYICEMGMLL